MRKVSIAIAIAAMCASFSMAFATSVDMAAPVVKSNTLGMEMVCIHDLPTSSTEVTTIVSESVEGDLSAKIYRNGNLLQQINDLMVSGAHSVHYLDANFDGYVDILIGTGTSRNYSALLVWNPVARCFDKVDNEMNGDILLHPAAKMLYLQCSGSWCSNFYTRYKLEGASMTQVDELVVISDRAEYYTFEVSDKYTLRHGRAYDKMGNLISPGTVDCSTSSTARLPREWQLILNAYDRFYGIER